MTLDDRISALKAKHADLEKALEAETQRPRPDSAVLAGIKREKLRIKDEIARLSDE